MGVTEYVFQISPMDAAALLPQVSRALGKRSELISRSKYPGLWKMTDRLNAGRSPEKTTKGQRLRSRLLGVTILALGVFLFVPGLMEPQRLLVPLLAGAAGMVIGLVTLLGSGKDRTNPFDRPARQLLESMSGISREQSVRVVFSSAGMILVEGDDAKTVLYNDFEYVIEGEDIFLITFDQQVTVLQKKDLTGSVADFREFISTRATLA